jgi:hypothetical protein
MADHSAVDAAAAFEPSTSSDHPSAVGGCELVILPGNL